jgi:2-iminobutanoate/2-iminopropanoate deaminase
MNPQSLFSEHAPAPIGPYSQAVAAGNLIFISGQIALDPESNRMDGDTIEQQTRQVMRNMKALLDSQGLSTEALVKTTIYLTSIDNFAACNRVYERELGGWKPARAVVEVRALPKGALVEIEGIACR